MLYKQAFKKKNENVDYDAIKVKKKEFSNSFQYVIEKQCKYLVCGEAGLVCFSKKVP
ncbi:hypothetical protein ACK6ST_15110 [Proteus terrae]|uniref:hypothetical protein n=1 Tax=Proteus terrae TaxID=1574161 RepID=UPI003C2CDECD